MEFKIVSKNFESPLIEAENADEAIIEFATNTDLDMNLYFEAIPVKECEPLMKITDIEWDLEDGESDYALPKTVTLNEFVEEDEIADHLSDEYGFCVRSFKLEDNSYNSAEAFTGISEYHNADEVTTQFEKLKTALFNAGTEAIEDFLGLELGALDDKDTIDKLMDDTIMQMPDDKFDEYYSEYVTKAVAEPKTKEETNNPDLLADIYVAYYENGERKEFECYDINNFFEDMDNDRLSFPKPSAELHEVKMNGKELYPADFSQLLLILGYEDNMKDDRSSAAVAIAPQTALTVLAANMPKEKEFFNSQSADGNYVHYMDLPNGRTLRIVSIHDEDRSYYSWEVLYNTNECDYTPRNPVMASEETEDLNFDTVYMELDWAIRMADETPISKPKFTVGDEVKYTKTDVFCYVVKVPDDGGLRLYDTCNDSVIDLRDDEVDSLVLEGHSEMAEKVFS